jgi:hypothetical protein
MWVVKSPKGLNLRKTKYLVYSWDLLKFLSYFIFIFKLNIPSIFQNLELSTNVCVRLPSGENRVTSSKLDFDYGTPTFLCEMAY